MTYFWIGISICNLVMVGLQIKMIVRNVQETRKWVKESQANVQYLTESEAYLQHLETLDPNRIRYMVYLLDDALATTIIAPVA